MMTKHEFVKERIPIDDLIEVGFFKVQPPSLDEVAERICWYFSLKNIFMYDFIMSDKNETIKADIKTFSIN